MFEGEIPDTCIVVHVSKPGFKTGEQGDLRAVAGKGLFGDGGPSLFRPVQHAPQIHKDGIAITDLGDFIHALPEIGYVDAKIG